MHPLSIAAIVAVSTLYGCAVPGIAPIPGRPPAAAPEVAVRLVVVPAGRHLLSTITEYRKSVHHANFAVYRRNADGTYPSVPTAAKANVLGTNLGLPIAIKSLRLGGTYKVTIAAYRSATEDATTLISVPASSQTIFTAPALQTVGGVATAVADLPVTLPLDLLKQVFAGHASYTLAITDSSIKGVVLRLKIGATVIATSTLASTPPSPTTYLLNSLKIGRSYTLEADGIKKNGDVVKSVSVSFTTPTTNATTGILDTTTLGPFMMSMP